MYSKEYSDKCRGASVELQIEFFRLVHNYQIPPDRLIDQFLYSQCMKKIPLTESEDKELASKYYPSIEGE